jgi:hypothetical protein
MPLDVDQVLTEFRLTDPNAALVGIEAAESGAEQRWKPLVSSINIDLVDHVLYPQLAAAIDRAHRAGNDMHIRPPEIAPSDYATRDAGELTWRLYAHCPDAVPDLDAHGVGQVANEALPPTQPAWSDQEPPRPDQSLDGPAI